MKRYEIEYCSLADHDMQESPTGQYVLYSDFEKLLKVLKNIRATTSHLKSERLSFHSIWKNADEALKEIEADL